MKKSKKAIPMMLMVAVLFVASACNTQKEQQDSTEEPSTVVESKSEVRGIVASVSGSTVTVDLIEVSGAEGRTAQNPFTLTGESSTIELTKDTPVVTAVRGENGVSEIAAEADAISKDDILYIFYKADGSIEKVRLVQR